ncbi:MAG: hypothetical protein UT84_C0014G0026 [Candidatus Curtissbacteria bacterium GW2011_GWA1_40_16]|uniref:Uncharacterized protein n=1 Tax=Candidatus Curtissbacteria bacterium GW2011_GWA1_40_16 TaxID=1618405 RepID=A0A0G0RCS5_9BACT|nr:MAG: hypothetical protein UT84_C0014G0026 [Candidatus Curtissbacteria bacterium GW2011_GWA1_40_16]
MSAENRANTTYNLERVSRQQTRRENIQGLSRRIARLSPIMVFMLAANLGLTGATKNNEPQKPEIHRQTITDALNNTGFYDAEANPPTNPQTPNNWGMVIPNPSNPPVFDFNDGIAHSAPGSVRITTEGTTTCESNGWITLQDFPVDPGKTYSLNFVAGYESSGNKVLPKIIVDWKNNAGQSLNSTDIATLTSNGNPDPVDNWYAFNRSYGPGQDASIPQGTAKGSMQVEGDPTGACTGTLHVDSLSMTTTDSPPPTPPSVGGVAYEPDTNSLQQPETTVTHSTRNTIVEIAVAGSAALAGTIVVAEAIRRKRNQG